MSFSREYKNCMHLYCNKTHSILAYNKTIASEGLLYLLTLIISNI